jgi:hypothetical protein
MLGRKIVAAGEGAHGAEDAGARVGVRVYVGET